MANISLPSVILRQGRHGQNNDGKANPPKYGGLKPAYCATQLRGLYRVETAHIAAADAGARTAAKLVAILAPHLIVAAILPIIGQESLSLLRRMESQS